jgi:hypothetical protein
MHQHLVGYAAHPNEVAQRIRAEGIPTIMGNYDDFAMDIETGGAITARPA